MEQGEILTDITNCQDALVVCSTNRKLLRSMEVALDTSGISQESINSLVTLTNIPLENMDESLTLPMVSGTSTCDLEGLRERIIAAYGKLDEVAEYIDATLDKATKKLTESYTKVFGENVEKLELLLKELLEHNNKRMDFDYKAIKYDKLTKFNGSSYEAVEPKDLVRSLKEASDFIKDYIRNPITTILLDVTFEGIKRFDITSDSGLQPPFNVLNRVLASAGWKSKDTFKNANDHFTVSFIPNGLKGDTFIGGKYLQLSIRTDKDGVVHSMTMTNHGDPDILDKWKEKSENDVMSIDLRTVIEAVEIVLELSKVLADGPLVEVSQRIQKSIITNTGKFSSKNKEVQALVNEAGLSNEEKGKRETRLKVFGKPWFDANDEAYQLAMKHYHTPVIFMNQVIKEIIQMAKNVSKAL